MSEISILRPISIEMEIIETDSYLPSFKTNIVLRIKHPTGLFLYQADDIWFDCSLWDKFILEISNVNYKTDISVKLSDISEYFNIEFVKETLNEVLFKVTIHEPFSGENGEGYISYQSKLDIDTMNIIKNNFESFDKWW